MILSAKSCGRSEEPAKLQSFETWRNMPRHPGLPKERRKRGKLEKTTQDVLQPRTWRRENGSSVSSVSTSRSSAYNIQT